MFAPQPLPAPFPPSPRLYAASLLRSWSTMFVPAECLRTVPCPLWDPSEARPLDVTSTRDLSHPSHTTRSLHTCAYRNCATGLAEWPPLTSTPRVHSAGQLPLDVSPPASLCDLRSYRSAPSAECHSIPLLRGKCFSSNCATKKHRCTQKTNYY